MIPLDAWMPYPREQTQQFGIFKTSFLISVFEQRYWYKMYIRSQIKSNSRSCFVNVTSKCEKALQPPSLSCCAWVCIQRAGRNLIAYLCFRWRFLSTKWSNFLHDPESSNPRVFMTVVLYRFIHSLTFTCKLTNNHEFLVI